MKKYRFLIVCLSGFSALAILGFAMYLVIADYQFWKVILSFVSFSFVNISVGLILDSKVNEISTSNQITKKSISNEEKEKRESTNL